MNYSADGLVLMSVNMKDLEERFWNWKGALESKGLKVNPKKTKVTVSRLEGELFKSMIDPCGVCGRRAVANSVFCTKCGNWVHGRCAKIKRATARFDIHFVCSRCRETMEGFVDSIKKLCDEVETVNGICYVKDRCRETMETTVDSIEKLCNEVETVNGFCYMKDRPNSSGGCKALL